MTPRNRSRILLAPSLAALGVLSLGMALAHAQADPAQTPPRTEAAEPRSEADDPRAPRPAPPRPSPSREKPRTEAPPVGETDPEPEVGKPKAVNTEERKSTPSTTENVPPVKVGLDLETTPEGVLVREVAPGSAADEAGLKVGDRIIRVAGSQVLTPTAIDRRFHRYMPESKLEIVALRKGREVKMMLVLPKTHEPVSLEEPEEKPAKVTVVDAAPAAAPALQMGWVLRETDGRVVVANVTEGSLAAVAGLRRGDVIVRADRTAIGTADGLTRYLSGVGASEKVVLEVERGTKVGTVDFVMPATHRVARPAVDAEVYHEILARQKVQEELLAKVLAELEALRAELKATRRPVVVPEP